MSAAVAPAIAPAEFERPATEPDRDAVAFVRRDADGDVCRLGLMVEGINCGGCVRRIEGALERFEDVVEARVNLTTRRLALVWRGGPERAGTLVDAVRALGYRVVPFDPGRLADTNAQAEQELLRCLAVAGFAAGNVMLLSIGVWAGHAQGMGEATRTLMHWVSALIAMPAVAYAGRPFFRSALRALAHGRTNMDVPISVGVLLATGVSLAETMRGGPHAYFDSGVTLLFFLLIGRYLDLRARGRARTAAERLLALGTAPITVLDDDGKPTRRPPESVLPGTTVLVAPGERIAVDGEVLAGRSDLDASLITGESLPAAVGPGERAFAGTVNLSAPLRLRVLASGDDTLLAEIVRLMEAAEQRRSRFVGLADRVGRAYAPAVHALALLAFLFWVLVGGAGVYEALLIAVAVLIVTCPCALGLAVPAVQIIACGRLMRRGILLKSASALERLAVADTVVFDKTGTLTLGRPRLQPGPYEPDTLRHAASLAGASRHPLARALVAAAPPGPVADDVAEVPGRGLIAGETRLGSRVFVGIAEDAACAGAELWLAEPNRAPVRFTFAETLRPDAAATVAELRRRGFGVEILSGDRAVVVDEVAQALGIKARLARCTPAEKVARLQALAQDGRRVLMVGDGLNDAPALAAAHVSMSPSTAADLSQTSADAVFQGERLTAVLVAIDVARKADRLVRQNFALAFGYNLVAVPLAVAGMVTPLVAAICMSASSILVVVNALRAARDRESVGAPTRGPGGKRVARHLTSGSDRCAGAVTATDPEVDRVCATPVRWCGQVAAGISLAADAGGRRRRRPDTCAILPGRWARRAR